VGGVGPAGVRGLVGVWGPVGVGGPAGVRGLVGGAGVGWTPFIFDFPVFVAKCLERWAFAGRFVTDDAALPSAFYTVSLLPLR